MKHTFSADMPHHPYTMLKDSRGCDTKIDAGLAPLITECWRLGIETSDCCQEASPGYADIGLLSLTDMESFFEAMHTPRKDDPRLLKVDWEMRICDDGDGEYLDSGAWIPVSLVNTLTDILKRVTRKPCGSSPTKLADCDCDYLWTSSGHFSAEIS